MEEKEDIKQELKPQIKAEEDKKIKEIKIESNRMALNLIIQPPGAFNFDQPSDWPDYRLQFERFLSLTTTSDFKDDSKITTLRYYLGRKGDVIFNTFKFNETDCKQNFENVLKKFDEYFLPRKNIIYERCVFNNRTQQESESAETYIREILKLAESCDFKDMREELVRDRLVVGIKDKKLSEELQQDPDLSLDKAMQKIKLREQTKQEQVKLGNASKPVTASENLDAVKQLPKRNQPFHNSRINAQNSNKNTSQNTKMSNFAAQRSCGRCGATTAHPVEQCPAASAVCKRCLFKGHYADYCRSTRRRQGQYRGGQRGRSGNSDRPSSSQQVTEVTTSDQEDDWLDDGFLESVTAADEWVSDDSPVDGQFLGEIKKQTHTSMQPWRTTLELGPSKERILFKVDSGADVSVIGPETFNTLSHKPPLMVPDKALFGPSGVKLHTTGMFHTAVYFNEKKGKEIIYVIKGLRENLLSRGISEKLGILTFKGSTIGSIELHSNWNPRDIFPKLFNGLGEMHTMYKIKLKDGAVPHAVATSRRIAQPLFIKLKTKLNNLEEKGVLSKVSEPTEWCANLVLVPKPNQDDFRLTIDSAPLAEAVVRDRITLPSVEESLSKMAGAKVFSKIDCKDGFWQIPLHPDSRLLTTFVTPWGRYCYNRLFMGLTSASEFFHCTISNLLSDLQGVVVHIDDIAIFGSSESEHDERLFKVLTRLQEFGVTLNNKCQFRVKEIKWVGYIVSGEGSKPDPQKLAAIQEIKPPTDRSGVKSFLARIEFLRKFVPHMADVIQPLTDLLSKAVDFTWGPYQEKAFKNVLSLLTQSPVLTLYDPNKNHRVSSDASSIGLGATLEQQEDLIWKPVSYISRRLSNTESRYATIEKEALGITWACNKFEEYILGKKFTIRTDHKPLVSIFGQKSLHEMSPRLQRMRMLLMRFDYAIEHVPGKLLHLPDLLSRSPSKNADPKTEFLIATIEEHGRHIIDYFPTSDACLVEIKKAQNQDVNIIDLTQMVKKGFPNSNKNLPQNLQAFWSVRHELNLQSGLLLYQTRIVIPSSLRSDMLKRLHSGHLGIDKCRARARETIYWPGLSMEIKHMVENCPTCTKLRTNPAEPLIPSAIPTRPWQNIAMDLAEVKGVMYLVVVDYYSKYPEVRQLEDIQSNTIINACKAIFSGHGVPEIVRSDNGTQFSSQNFASFAKTYKFKHVTSSPRYPQSNGQAEAAVKIVKNILKKCDDPHLGLLAYRNTPLAGLKASPAQLLMGRSLRTTVPTIPKKLRPKLIPYSQFAESESTRKMGGKAYHDKHRRARTLKPLAPGDEVWITDLERRGKIVELDKTPRSYIVATSQGTLRRNRRHLSPLQSPPNKVTGSPKLENPTSGTDNSLQTPPTTIRQPSPGPPRLSPQTPIPSSASQHLRMPEGGENSAKRSRTGRPIKTPRRLDL